MSHSRGKHTKKGAALALEGYDSSETGSDDDDNHASFLSGSAKGSKPLSKQASEKQLAKDLNRVSEYAGGSNKAHSLKEFLGNKSGSKHMKVKEQPARLARRSSIASINSQSSMSWFDQSQLSPTRSRAASSDGILSVTDITDLGGGSASIRSFRSDTTQPVANWKAGDSASAKARAAKTEQIVESLVWFSFHIPRTVLEDLIRHELILWRLEASKQVQSSALKGKRTKSSRQNQRLSHYANAYNSSRDDDSEADNDEDSSQSSQNSQASVRSTSSSATAASIFDGMNFSEAIMRVQGKDNQNMMSTPKSVSRESCLLFVDLSGFTKLSTILEVEAFAKVINSYFDMIVGEVILHGGDVLAFAGKWQQVGSMRPCILNRDSLSLSSQEMHFSRSGR